MKVRPPLVAFAAALAVLLLSASPTFAVEKVIALQGTFSPLPGLVYQRFGDLDVSDAAGERVVAYARLRGRQCLFRIDPDNDPDSKVVCQREVSPDGRAFTRLGPPSINGSSAVAFGSRATSGASGVYRNVGAVTSIVALAHDDAPCLPSGPADPVLARLAFGRITDAGDVAFTAELTGCAPAEINDGVFVCSGGDGNCSTQIPFLGTGVRTTIALAGDAVPDRPGRFFCDFHQLDASTYGVVFRASTKLDCADAAELPLDGVFRRTFPAPGAVTTIALEGETANPPGTLYGAPTQSPAISNTGMVVFNTEGALGPRPVYIYMCDPATCPAVRADSVATPGTADDDGDAFQLYGAPGVNDLGDVGFSARYRGFSGNRDGLYRAIRVLLNPYDIQTIAKSGDVSPIPPDIYRTLPGPTATSPSGRVASKAIINRSTNPRRAQAIVIDE